MTRTVQEEVAELVYARARAVDEGDVTNFLRLLSAAVVVVEGQEFVGHALNGLIVPRPRTSRHLVTNVRVQPGESGDRETPHLDACSYFTVLETAGTLRVVAAGQYQDRLEQVGDRWVFTRHEILVDG